MAFHYLDKLDGTLVGTVANDWFFLNGGSGTIYGDDGKDTVSFSGNSKGIFLDQIVLIDYSGGVIHLFDIEKIVGSSNSDEMHGDAKDNEFNGYFGNDTLKGNDGNDILFGSFGGDLLDGGDDNDVLNGSAGNDTLIGGNGVDVLTGGDGIDRFVFNGPDQEDAIQDTGDVYMGQADTITDFQSGLDTIHIPTGLEAFGFVTSAPPTGHYSVWQKDDDFVVTWRTDAGYHDIVVQGNDPTGSIYAVAPEDILI